jgi:2-polyprenyl-3-methyl-5-hydroxy-6-metoxy-1,4-benzoquinol methylase
MKTEPTTERLIVENYQSNEESYLIYLVHIATYRYCINYVAGKKVLDYGCGSGYGTALISDSCLQITGIDVSSEAIAHAKDHYNASNLSYLKVERAEDASLPFPDASFEVVLSFQVIEHVQDVSVYLQEIERVLVPGGHVIIATPDRSSRLFSFQKPWNMWHLREYTQNQLNNTLAKRFSNVNVKQIGGRKDVLEIELNRTSKLKWIMLPFTLPFIPEFVRKNSLLFIKYLKYNLSRHSSSSIEPTFDESALSISNNEKFSVDLIATAQKTTSVTPQQPALIAFIKPKS